jgi:hypothetical protein
MTDSSQFSSLQRNRVLSQTIERILTHIVRFGAVAVNGLVKFIQEMVRTAVGK